MGRSDFVLDQLFYCNALYHLHCRAMVWREEDFQKTKASKPVKQALTNAILFLENQSTGRWQCVVQDKKILPLSCEFTFIKAENSSTLTLRLFLGHPTNPTFDICDTRGRPPPHPHQPVRDKLENIGFIGVTGFSSVEDRLEVVANIQIDTEGVMMMSVVEKDSGDRLLIGTKSQYQLKRKVFEPSFKTSK